MKNSEEGSSIRRCRADERDAIRRIINAAAERYRGAIPDDCFHDPYMSPESLSRDIDAGVEFWGYESEGQLVGVMGIQPLREVDLIRHAYVRPDWQGRGVGGALLEQLRAGRTRPMLIGTWRAADWAIAFYQRHGFELVDDVRAQELLGRYWTVSPRQAATSVVLEQARRA